MKLKVISILLIIGSYIGMVKGQSPIEYLLPIPKNIKLNKGELNLKKGRIICPNNSHELVQIASAIKKSLETTNIKAEISAQKARKEVPLVTLSLNKKLGAQAYSLIINKKQMRIEGGDLAGLYYASCTVAQLAQYAKKSGGWPCLKIKDKPDFPRRGVMLDISRDKVPTMKTLYQLIDQFASWKINEIQLYTEHTFAYQNHKLVWEKASPMTAEQILLLDSYCKERFIDLVPNQNSFGHMEKWLKHEEYLHLAELPEPGKTIWGMRSKGSISPAVPQSLELIKELYTELLPNFSSNYFNIGCDETVELGVGRSKKLCKRKGTGKVYLDFLLQLKKEAEKQNKTIQFWGDIILHHPDLIPQLPKDMVALVWGYEAKHPFKKQCAQFKKAKIPFYVCPGTSSWGTIIGRNQNAFANLYNAAINGKKYGAKGFLNTDWGDFGHWQPIPVSYPAFAYGAALSWQVEKNKEIKIPQLISQQAFKDPTGISGTVINNLGNAYLKVGVLTDNSNILHKILLLHAEDITKNWMLKRLKKENLIATKRYISEQLELFEKAELNCIDATIVKEEIIQAAKLATFACNYALAKLEASKNKKDLLPHKTSIQLQRELENLIFNHQRIWLMRNRLGGLEDSTNHMKEILQSLKNKQEH